MMSLSVVHREGGMVRPARPWKVEIFLGSRFMLVSKDGTFCGPQGEWNICLGPMFDFFFRPTPYGSRQVVKQAGKLVAYLNFPN